MSARPYKKTAKIRFFPSLIQMGDSLHALQRFQYLDAKAGLHLDETFCSVSTGGMSCRFGEGEARLPTKH